MKACTLASVLACGLVASASATTTTTVTFDNGWEDWHGIGSVIMPTGGNPGARAHTDHHGHTITYWTTENQAFLGDFTQYASVTLSIDIRVDEISTLMGPGGRNLVLEISNYSNAPVEFMSAWILLDELDGNGADWTTYSVTFDPNNLGAAWQGSDAGQVGLPDGFTFADIMAGVEDVRFTASEPGFQYIGHYFDVSVDNISITTVPIPAPGAALAMLGLGMGAVARRRR